MSTTQSAPPESGSRAAPRPRQWDRIVAIQRRLLNEHMAWPVASLLSLGLIASFMIGPGYLGPWAVLVALTIVGGFANVQTAAALGVLAFISYGTWMFWVQLQHGITGGDFIILAFMPFAPLWLAAMRARQRDLMHLDALLTLPQVRAAMDVSTWSLLPSARALDLRLQAHLGDGTNVTAVVLFRIDLLNLEQSIALLGDRVVRGEVMQLANMLREKLRVGDLIAEDLKHHGNLYVLTFPNPRDVDPVTILRRLLPALSASELRVAVQYAQIPEDGTRMYALTWHDSAMLEP